jgi:hypothetical protein
LTSEIKKPGWPARMFVFIRKTLMAIGKPIGRVQTFLLMLISFYLVLLPTAIFYRLLVRNQTPRGRWIKRSPVDEDHLQKQF